MFPDLSHILILYPTLNRLVILGNTLSVMFSQIVDPMFRLLDAKY